MCPVFRSREGGERREFFEGRGRGTVTTIKKLLLAKNTFGTPAMRGKALKKNSPANHPAFPPLEESCQKRDRCVRKKAYDQTADPDRRDPH